MNEKLKPNFTPVPNVIFDKVMRTVSGADLKRIMAICREGDSARIEDAVNRALRKSRMRKAGRR
jgi:hypothetical protein